VDREGGECNRMIASSVLWLILAGGQVVTIPCFASNDNCEQVGMWYRDEAARGGKASVQYRCGPGPDLGPRPYVVRPPYQLGPQR